MSTYASSRRAQPQPARSPMPPSNEAIKARAFDIYQARMAKKLPGDPQSDWAEAERQLGVNNKAAEAHAKVRGETLLHEDEDA